MHWRQLLLRYLWCFHSDSSTLFLSQNTKLTPDDMIGVDMEMFCSSPKPDPNPPSPASSPNLTQTTISTMPSGDTTWCRTLRISHPPQSELICWWYNPLHVLARDGIKMTFFEPTSQPASQPAGQIPSLTMGDSAAAEAGTTLKLRMSSELKKKLGAEKVLESSGSG